MSRGFYTEDVSIEYCVDGRIIERNQVSTNKERNEIHYGDLDSEFVYYGNENSVLGKSKEYNYYELSKYSKNNHKIIVYCKRRYHMFDEFIKVKDVENMSLQDIRQFIFDSVKGCMYEKDF